MAVDATIIVGGKGDGSAASDNHGGGYTDNYTGTWVDAQKDNGLSVNLSATWGGSQIACSMVESPDNPGKVRVTFLHGFDLAKVGMLANIETVDGTYPDDRYEVLAIDSSNGNYVDIDLAYISDSACDIHVGGAMKTPVAATDLVVDGEATDFLISQDATSGFAETIIFATGGDHTDPAKKLFIKGVSPDDGELLPAGSYITLTEGTGPVAATMIWDDINNVSMAGIYLTGSNTTGLNISNGASGYNYFIENCKLADNTYGLYINGTYVNNVFVRNCVFSSNSDGDIQALNIAIDCLNCRFESNVVSQVVVKHVGMFRNCIFIDGEKAIVHSHGYILNVSNCVFYNQSVACIDNGSSIAAATVVAYSNIFMPAATANKSILMTRGSTLYADYNCYWSVAGGACDYSDYGGGDNAIEINPQFDENYLPATWQLMESGIEDTGGNPTHIGAVGKPSAYDIIVAEES